jgi:hypothetical protein
MQNVDKSKQKSNFFFKNSNPDISRNLSTINNKQSFPIKSSKKNLNVIEFIKEKNKFYFKNFFDENEAKKFLKSKDIALMEIKLNEEIIFVNNKFNNSNLIEKSFKLMNNSLNMNENNFNIINKSENENGDEYLKKINNRPSNLNIYENSIKISNKSENEDGNENCTKIINKSANVERNNDKDSKNNISPEIRRGKTIVKNKKRKKEKKIRKNKTERKKLKKKNFDNLEDKNNMILKVNDKKSNSHDSQSSHHIYKFIIDNANESEDKFNEKFEKEIKRFKTKRLNSRNYNNYFKTNTHKKSNNEDKVNNIRQSMTNKFTRKNIFDFSQNAKALMESNDFEVSSINDKTIQNKNESNFLKNLDSKGKKDINRKSIFADEKNNNDNNIKINSEHHSLMSILSDLM